MVAGNRSGELGWLAGALGMFSHAVLRRPASCFGRRVRSRLPVHGDPLANQFDSPFLVRLIRKEVTHTSGFPFGIKTRDPDIPSCRHSGTMRRSCCWSIPCHNQAGPLPGKDTPVSDIPQRFQWPAIRECCAMGGRSRRSLESGRRDRLWAPLIFPWRPRQ